MAIVGVAIAIPITIAARGGDGEPQAAAPVADAAVVPGLHPQSHDRELGIAYRVPEGWREVERTGAVSLRSRDRSAEIVVAAPAPAGESGRVLDEALAAVRSGYERVRLEQGLAQRVGGLRVDGAVASVRAPNGTPLRILIAVANGEKRTYLVEVFTTASASAERVREAQVALNSLRFKH
jgi:hypothetical protein